MLRSFLVRPHPLLSRLRCHDHEWCRPVAQLCHRACWHTSRGCTSSEDDTDADDLDHRTYTRRHLYLVLDDWKKGSSIHKLDLDKDDGSEGGDVPLPPPAHRQEKKHGRCHWNFACMGSKIVAAGALDADEDPITLMYDTETTAVSVVPRLPAALCGPWTLATAAGNGLNVFEANSQKESYCDEVGHGMHRLDAPKYQYRQQWTWGKIPSTLPFSVGEIESSVVHPEEGGGRGTLFVNVGRWVRKKDEDGNPVRTIWGQSSEEDFTRTSEIFSYAGSGEWRRHGEFDLPFLGEGHYDGELDAWVGLHKIHRPASWDEDANMTHQMDGYLCSSDVRSRDGSTAQQPDWKLCAERLFNPRDASHVGASLVYMGDNTYCLVEVEALERFKKRRLGNKSAINLDIFRLRYGKSGELEITKSRPHRSYIFSRFDANHKLRAFWM